MRVDAESCTYAKCKTMSGVAVVAFKFDALARADLAIPARHPNLDRPLLHHLPVRSGRGGGTHNSKDPPECLRAKRTYDSNQDAT